MDQEYKLKYTTVADSAAAEQLLITNQKLAKSAAELADSARRERSAGEIGQHSVGWLKGAAEASEKAGQAHQGHARHTNALLVQMKAMNAELGRVPEMSALLHLVRHPIVLAAVALGAVVAKAREAWEAVNEFSASARAVRQLELSMASLRAETQSLAMQDEMFLDQLWKIQAATQSVAAQQERYNEELNRTARLRTEAVDLKLATDIARIEADRTLRPDQKTLAKWGATTAAARAKHDIEVQRQQGDISGIGVAGKEAAYAEDMWRGLMGVARAEEAAAKQKAKTAAGNAKTSEELATKHAKEIEEAEALVKRRAGRRPGLFEGDTWRIIADQLYFRTLSGPEAARKDLERKRAMGTPFLNQYSIDDQAATKAQDDYERAQKARAYVQQQIDANEQTRVKAQLDFGLKTKQYNQENAAAENRLRQEGEAQRLAAQQTAQKQAAEWYLERAREQLKNLESTMGPNPTQAQQTERMRLLKVISGLELPGPENADVRGMRQSTQQNELRKGWYNRVMELFPEIGPAAFWMMGPPPASGGSPGGPSMDQFNKAVLDAGKKVSMSLDDAVSALQGFSDAVGGSGKRLSDMAEHAAWVGRTG